MKYVQETPLYALHTYLFYTVWSVRESVEGNIIQSISAATIELRAFFYSNNNNINDNNNNNNNNSDFVKLLKPVKYF